MYQTILLPTDGTPGTKQVAERAFDLASKYDATIQALNAILDVHPEGSSDLEEHTLGVDLGNLRADLEKKGQATVAEIDAWADEAGVPCVTDVVIGGPPDEAILEYADEHDVDIIVMGTHGRTGLARWLGGSVAEDVVRHAEIPVLSVRLPEPEPENQ